jgi:hypothetical protein
VMIVIDPSKIRTIHHHRVRSHQRQHQHQLYLLWYL